MGDADAAFGHESCQHGLQRWERISGTRVEDTRSGATNPGTGAAPGRSFDAAVLDKIGEDYAAYMGPMAPRLVRHYSASAVSLEQLVESLAGEIPDAGDSQKFRDAWI